MAVATPQLKRKEFSRDLIKRVINCRLIIQLIDLIHLTTWQRRVPFSWIGWWFLSFIRFVGTAGSCAIYCKEMPLSSALAFGIMIYLKLHLDCNAFSLYRVYMGKTISEVDIRGNSFRANEAVKSETKSAD